MIGGTPDTADANAASATVTVSDAAGNTDPVPIAFPPVAKGDQTLTGFQYSSNTVMLESPAPTVTAPSGVQTALSYSVTASTVCTVGSSTGVLTLVGVGECEVIATAADTADYNEAKATYTVTVQPVDEPLIAPTAIAQTAGDTLTTFVVDHLIDGSGLSATPTLGNFASVTHDSSASANWWLTFTQGSPSYFADSRNRPDPQFTLTLDGLYSLSALVVWGLSTNHGNEASNFRVEFSSDGGVTYSSATETLGLDRRTDGTAVRLSFGDEREANFVRLTITNNAKGRGFPGAGGDRVALGEIRFAGSAVASNAPPVAMAGALATLVNTAGTLDLSTLASDAEAGTLSYAVTQPSNGSVSLTGAVVTYTPNDRLRRFGQFHLHGDGCGQRPRHRHGQRDRAPGADGPGRRPDDTPGHGDHV